MGTRSITRFVDANKQTYACMYRQFDGYLDGHGKDLREAFGDMMIVNGMRGEETPIANGIGCLAAQVIAKLKDGPGGIYLSPENCESQDFNYEIYPEKTDDCGMGIGRIMVKVMSENEQIYEGALADLPGDTDCE